VRMTRIEADGRKWWDGMGTKKTAMHANGRRQQGSMKTQGETAQRSEKNRSGGQNLSVEKRCEPQKCDERTQLRSDGLGA
jgi:hypothetical protein